MVVVPARDVLASRRQAQFPTLPHCFHCREDRPVAKPGAGEALHAHHVACRPHGPSPPRGHAPFAPFRGFSFFLCRHSYIFTHAHTFTQIHPLAWASFIPPFRHITTTTTLLFMSRAPLTRGNKGSAARALPAPPFTAGAAVPLKAITHGGPQISGPFPVFLIRRQDATRGQASSCPYLRPRPRYIFKFSQTTLRAPRPLYAGDVTLMHSPTAHRS